MFVTFEGPDGSGKTTAIEKIVKWLKSINKDFILTREPGSGQLDVNKRIRNILVDKNLTISGMTEAILFSADRRSHLETLIWPALKKNKLVLCDRYFDSTFAYQGSGRHLGIDKMIELQKNITDNTFPDITIYFDVSLEESIKRVSKRGDENRLDLENKDFVERVHKGYCELIKKFPNRYRVIDANKKPEEVFQQVKKIFEKEII